VCSQVSGKSARVLTLRVSGLTPLVENEDPVVFDGLAVLGLRGLLPSLSQILVPELWRCGFHPDPQFRTQLAHTNEFGLDGGFIRPVFALRCMRGGPYLQLLPLNLISEHYSSYFC
jgi:hypothetical protein